MQFERGVARVKGRARAALVIKENAIRKSNDLVHGFSLWQVKAKSSRGFSQISLNQGLAKGGCYLMIILMQSHGKRNLVTLSLGF